jgi:hypothetical protein
MQNQTESSVLDYRLSTIEDQLEGLKSDMQDMNSKQTQIIEALLGNPISQTKGLSAEFKEIKKKVFEHEEILKKVKWFWLGVVAFGSIMALIIELAFKLFT